MDVVTHHKCEKNTAGPLLKVGSHAPFSTSLPDVPSTILKKESNNTDVLQALYHRRKKVPGNNLKSPNRRDYAQSVETTRQYVEYAGHHLGLTLDDDGPPKRQSVLRHMSQCSKPLQRSRGGYTAGWTRPPSLRAELNGNPSTIAMIVLENGDYYQVRIIPDRQESHWSLGAVDSMLPATTALADSPTPLRNAQLPDPLTAIVSGTAGTWHPGHALYCLWRWAQRRWPHTRAWSAAWRFYLDGRQQLEAIPERMAETPTAPNLCPVFAIHQIRALALGQQMQPTIRSETAPRRQARSLCTKSSVPSAAPLCNAWETPQGPEPQPATGPTATKHRHTRATRVLHRPYAREGTTRRPRDQLLPPEDPAMDVTPTAAESAVNRENPGRASLAQKNPLVQSDNARQRNTLQQHLSVGHIDGKDVNLPGTCNGHPQSRV